MVSNNYTHTVFRFLHCSTLLYLIFLYVYITKYYYMILFIVIQHCVAYLQYRSTLNLKISFFIHVCTIPISIYTYIYMNIYVSICSAYHIRDVLFIVPFKTQAVDVSLVYLDNSTYHSIIYHYLTSKLMSVIYPDRTIAYYATNVH